MRKKLLFLTSMLLLFATSCQKEFSAERARELASLHANASDYTASEIREIEEQVDLYFVLAERMMDGALYERDAFERKRKIIKFAAWCKTDIDIVDTMADLAAILRENPHTDAKKFESYYRKLSELMLTIEMIQEEM